MVTCNYNDKNLSDDQVKHSLKRKLEDLNHHDFTEKMISIQTVFFNFTTHFEGCQGAISTDGEFERTRKIVILRGSSRFLEMIKAFFSRFFEVHCTEKYKPDRYHLEQQIQNLFQDIALNRELNDALELAYISCKTIIWYASLDTEKTHLRLEDSVGIDRAYNAAPVTRTTLSAITSIFSLLAIALLSKSKKNKE